MTIREDAYRRGFAVANLLVALALGGGVFGGLPTRWAWVDVPSVALLALLGVSSGALLFGAKLARPLARVTAAALLALGLVVIFALVLGIAFLRGIYGTLGADGVLLFSLAILFVLPYLVVYPLGLWWWSRRAS